MSSQRSILSFFSTTPIAAAANGHSSSPASTKTEDASTSTTTRPKNGHSGNASTNATTRTDVIKFNEKSPSTSTPKRKKSATPKSSGKKTKLSPSKSKRRSRVAIEDDEDDDDIELVEEQKEKETSTIEKSKNGDSVLLNATTNDDDGDVSGLAYSSISSHQNGSNITQNSDVNVSASNNLDDAAAVGNEFEHTKLDFLKPEKIKDSDCRRPDDNDYNPTTLYVPDIFLKQLTPILREWWKFKANNYDKILLFKVGKFYELYHMDAVTAVNVLNLTYMKGGVGMDKKKSIAHCGFPEIAFGRFSDQLVQHGYKVARIEQTETPEMLQARNAQCHGRKEKIVRRELCRIVTPGTKTYSFLDSDDCAGSPKLLLALAEIAEGTKRRYGVCFADCAVGKIWMSEFDDDHYSSRLRTLLAQYTPAEVLYTKKFITPPTENILNGLYACKLEQIAWKTQFMTASDALKKISERNYFTNDEEKKETAAAAVDNWPDVLRRVLSDGDVLGGKCKKQFEMTVSSLGAVIWYLEKCLIDDDILTLGLIEWYEPTVKIELSQSQPNDNDSTIPALKSKTMVLDSAALKNLDIIQSSSKLNSVEGTLLELLDTCSTVFGKRLLRHWLCNPLCHIEAIVERQRAIGALLLEQNDFAASATASLKGMPDLERLLQKIHTIGMTKRLDHPDSRAVFFEGDKYNKRKVDDFLKTLDGFRMVLEVTDSFAEIAKRTDSSLLRRLLQPEMPGGLSGLRRCLKEIESKFDRKRAENEGIVVISADLAEISRSMEEITAEFDSYLQEQRKKLAASSVKYCQTVGKNRYMLEIPEAVVSRIPSSYKFVGQIKGFRRFSTDRIDELLESLEKIEEKRDVTYRDSMRRVFEAFSDSHGVWRAAVDSMATLDVLLSLTRYVQHSEYAMCAPNIINAGGNRKPFIKIINGYHPCSAKIFTTLGQFVPNDTVVGVQGDSASDASVLLLTGPNMGGKSTLMRQAASLVILAQIGSYVPAESFSLSLVDRIFTRLGACDRLAAGESTFAVELTEAKMVLRHATVHSLVVIDELGRGTATHDGAALAYAVLKYLAGFEAGPRTLFSTHYHGLVARLHGHPNIALGHMACTVENENVDDPSEETVTFLYKLAPGACPKSYGFYAAKLAGIPKEIVKRAYANARESESVLRIATKFCQLAGKVNLMTDEKLVSAVEDLLASK